MFHLRAKLPRGLRTPHSEAATRKSGNRGHHPPNPGYSPLPVPRTTKKCSKNTGRLPARRRGAGGGRTSLRGSGTAGSPTPRGAGRGGSPQPSDSNLASRGPRNLAAAGAPGRSPARGAPPRLPAQPRPPPSPARVRVPPPSPPPRAVGEGPRHLSPTGRENKAAAARTFFGVCSALPQATTYRSGFGRFGESRRAPASASPSRSGSSARLHGPRTVPPARRPRAPSSRPPSPSRLQAGGRGAGARGRGRAARAGPAGSCSFPLRAVEGLAPPGRKGRRGPPRSWTPL